MRKFVTGLSMSASGLALALLAGATAMAQLPTDTVPTTTPTGVSSGFSSVPSLISTIYTIVIGAAAAIFVVLLIVGGATYLGSAGNEEGTGKAKKLMLDAVIGLIIVLAAWAIGQWVINRFFGTTSTF